MNITHKPIRGLALLSLSVFSLFNAAHAQEIYGGAGLFGVQLGYAQSINQNLTVRIDHLSLGSQNDTQTESGTVYSATAAVKRTGIFADYFPGGAGFRFTAGITSNNIGIDLNASNTGTVDINGTQYTLNSGDSLNIKVKLPKTTPYLGIGYGHQKAEKGWGFHADLGVILGSLKVTEKRTGSLAGISQTNVDAELAEVRDSVSKLKVFPQLTVGINYRF